MNTDEVCTMKPFTEAHRNLHHEGGASGQGGEDSDDEDQDPRGGTRVNCAQQ